MSRENDFDADGWISQAKQLHADIERSRHTAREIVSQHENTKPLELKVEDAAVKVALIETEIAFNDAVTNTLEAVDKLCQQLETGRTELNEGKVMVTIEILETAGTTIKTDSLFTSTNVMSILSENVAGLRREVVDFLHARWDEQLSIDRQQRKLCISKDGGNVSLEETITALARLDILGPANVKLQKDLLSAIIEPILLPGVHLQSRGVSVTDTEIEVESDATTVTVSEMLDRLVRVLDYLRQSLPTSISASFSDNLVPSLSSKIISFWLSSAIPTELEGLSEFENTLDQVLKFAQSVQTFGWYGHEELVSWVNQAPRLWLTRRRVDSLDQVRKVLAASHGTTKQVERVEKEQVSKADGAILDNSPSDDWDAGWDDENEEEANEKPAESAEEEDVSAWGLDDDDDVKEDVPETKPEATASTEEDDADDAWGWGDEEDEEPQKETSQPLTATKTKPTNSNEASEHTSREVTLRETYMVTDIPDSIIDVLRRQITDSETIAQPGLVSLPHYLCPGL